MPDPLGLTTARLTGGRASDASHRENNLLLACGLACGASLIHVQAAADHLGEYWLYGLLFIILACAQFMWSVAVYRSARRGLLLAGIVVSLGVVAIWILSRTTGLPVGPERGSAEPLGVLDAVASADEIALVVLLALQLRPPRITKLTSGTGSLLRAGAVGLIFLSSLVLAGGIHAH